MANFNDLFKSQPAPVAQGDVPPLEVEEQELELTGEYDDEELLELWKQIRLESFQDRWVFERQWLRNIYYVLGRQWIEYFSTYGGWRDKRMARYIPRPVTNKCKETVQALRAMFTSIKFGTNIRPNGTSPEAMSTAATCDELAPVLHDAHQMNQVQSEFDFWLCTVGNAFLHTFVDYDLKYGVIIDSAERCLMCGEVSASSEISKAEGKCPKCGQGTQFEDVIDPKTGAPLQTRHPKGQPVTIPLSPLEIAFPNDYARFDDLPYVVRLRWRTKHYFENHPVLKELVPTITWMKAPNDRSLQIFKSLSTYNDLGVTPVYVGEMVGGDNSQDGTTEFEVWYKPCDKYPEGLVFRVYGDSAPVVAHLEDEAIPGPLPYKDAEGNPIFTFAHAGYDHVGGRILASGPLDVIIQKQDQLNQLDSNIQLTVSRMSNPVWLEPKGMEIERLTGMPGLVVKYNALVGNGAKPERLEGVGPHPSLFQLREQYLKDIEELAGTFDIIKGAKPTGVEAFSALQLLVERSQSRFAGVFNSRGEAYKAWYGFAIELEREFGPDERTKYTLEPGRTWTYETFKRAQLKGSVSVLIEDGSNIPKTSLGFRAAIEHASQLGMLNMQDPDTQYESLKYFGLNKLVPAMDINIQSALQKQHAFEVWVNDEAAQQQSLMQAEQGMAQYEQELAQVPEDPMADPMAPPQLPQPPSMLAATPLEWLDWYSPSIHRQEFIKWANSDKIREILKAKPELKALLKQHLVEINMALAQEQMAANMATMGPQRRMGGAAEGMNNSNRESTSGNEPRGSGQGAQNAGPA